MKKRTSREDVAWAAGVFDGEGCISIVRIPAKCQKRCLMDRFTLHLKVTMGHRPTVLRLRKIFGTGSVQNHVARSARVNSSYSWICQSRQAERVLKTFYEFLLTKKKEAAIALEFLAIPLAKRGGPGGTLPTNRWLFARRERLYWRLRKLKSRWRFYAVKELMDE